MIYGFWFLLMKKRFNHSSSLTSNGEKEKGFLVEMEKDIQRDTERNKTGERERKVYGSKREE